MQLIDTHVHINFDTFKPDLSAVRERWREAGVVKLVHSCVEPAEFADIQALADKFPELSFAVGLHPLDAHKWTSLTADEILSLARTDSRVVAIGEIGLDFYKAQDVARQKEVFTAQLELAHQLKKPVIIHCRDSSATMRDLLQDFWKRHTPLSGGDGVKTGRSEDGEIELPSPLPSTERPAPIAHFPRGVMHCWGGTPEETQWFLDLGFHISFSGIVTFKNALQIQESARMCPSSRLLIETDCPFLAPVPKRGKRNEPAYVRYVAEYLAHLRNVSIDTLAAQTTQNACQLFGLTLPKSSP